MNRTAALALLGLVVVSWNATFVLTAVHGVLVPIACVAGVLGAAGVVLGRSQLSAWTRRPAAGLAWGAALGVLLAVLSHAAYRAAVPLLPLAEPVAGLYAMLRKPPGPVVGLPLMLLTVVAEEVLFRGLLLDALRPRLGRRAVVVSAGLYALANLGSGTWVLPVMALLLGLLWGALAERSGGLSVPLWCHLVWDVLVFAVVPLVPA